jgi:hypothetical protein
VAAVPSDGSTTEAEAAVTAPGVFRRFRWKVGDLVRVAADELDTVGIRLTEDRRACPGPDLAIDQRDPEHGEKIVQRWLDDEGDGIPAPTMSDWTLTPDQAHRWMIDRYERWVGHRGS